MCKITFLALHWKLIFAAIHNIYTITMPKQNLMCYRNTTCAGRDIGIVFIVYVVAKACTSVKEPIQSWGLSIVTVQLRIVVKILME